jgi:hypothetical protein
MAKVPGFLRPREKIDEAEVERVRIRTLERLAAIFGDAAAALEAPADLHAATEQAPADLPAAFLQAPADLPATTDHALAVQAPRDLDPAPGTAPQGASRPPTQAGWPPDLVGVMAEPECADVEAPLKPNARPEPNAETFVGVMEGPDPANKVGPTDDLRSRADAYVLAVAFGDARRPIAASTRRADPIKAAPAAGPVDLRREGPPAVDSVSGPVFRKVRADRPRPVSGRHS